MEPLKPYLVRTYHEWIQDSRLTPYLLIQANLPHVVVPPQYIDQNDDTIVLNISAVAISNLDMSKNKNQITFQARFDGVLWDVCVPYYAILGIYAAEDEEASIMFELNNDEIADGQKIFEAAAAVKNKPAASHPHLRVIKNEEK